jgi:hypothetical protein
MILAIDPGTRATGLATITGQTLDVFVLPWERAAAWILSGPRDGAAIVEVPEARRGSPVPVNDLVQLAGVAGGLIGACMAMGMTVRRVTPAQWKGAIPKAVHHRRVRAQLAEHRPGWLSGWDATRHDGRDAIALAIWGSGGLP